MNGNNPHAGLPGITKAGKRSQVDVPDLTPDQKRALRREVSRIAARTRDFLPDEYVVNANVANGVGGPRATVAVRPPVGQPVSADFSPDENDLTAEGYVPIDADDREEVARGLAASAALQVKRSIADDVMPTAR
jgi:hypothetical protein